MIKTIFIVGPTASGKTNLSIEIAKKYNGEIICADSMQLYRGIHIASAAPDFSEQCGVPHHMLEFLELDQAFSVADYVSMARKIIVEINNRKKLPIIVGGTGLYISSLLDNTYFIESEIDFDIRNKIEQEFDLIGSQNMLLKLSEFDPDSAKRLHPNNRRRIIRAFEIYQLTGKTITELNKISHNTNSFILPLVIGITYDNREILYNRINDRVDIMIAKGLLDEAKNTYAYANGKGAFQAIGHKELYPYFNNEVTLDTAIETLKRQTRRYAKRQLTWFRRDNRVNWIFADVSKNVTDNAFNLVNSFI